MSSNLPVIVLASLLIRWLVSLHGYSGQGKPPMFGDYEAQRHWMEITNHVSIGDWYRQTQQNDLQYWGLDYPPLTAYVSFLFSQLANVICPELVAFRSSRGHESVNTKIFMRSTVLYCDLVFYFPMITAMLLLLINKPSLQPGFYLLIILLTPSALLIDHGHFQYNNVSIALTLGSAAAICTDADILGSILFVLALNFKQMALYYSLVIFCVLLRKCLMQRTWTQKLMKLTIIGSTVIASFALLWFPFCIYRSDDETCISSMLHVLTRLFPFNRGIFEDKVANIWYGLSVVYDYRQKISMNTMKIVSMALTLLLMTPTILVMLRRRLTPSRLMLGLTNGSLAFFLASFQVHEKSLLLSLVPAALMTHIDPLLFAWYQIIGTFSMFPLLVKDGQRLSYWATVVLYCCLVSGYFELVPTRMLLTRLGRYSTMRRLFVAVSLSGCIVLHAMELWVSPPSRYPDLYPALFALYSLANLILFYLISNYYMVIIGDESIEPQPKRNQSTSLGLKEAMRKYNIQELIRQREEELSSAAKTDHSSERQERRTRSDSKYLSTIAEEDEDDEQERVNNVSTESNIAFGASDGQKEKDS